MSKYTILTILLLVRLNENKAYLTYNILVPTTIPKMIIFINSYIDIACLIYII